MQTINKFRPNNKTKLEVYNAAVPQAACCFKELLRGVVNGQREMTTKPAIR